MPAASRSATSSRMARAIWKAVSRRGWSSRTNDHCRIVIGPVSIPFIGRAVSDWAYCDPADGHRPRAGARRRK